MQLKKQTTQNITGLVQLSLMTLGQETRWAYSTMLPSPNRAVWLVSSSVCIDKTYINPAVNDDDNVDKYDDGDGVGAGRAVQCRTWGGDSRGSRASPAVDVRTPGGSLQ